MNAATRLSILAYHMVSHSVNLGPKLDLKFIFAKLSIRKLGSSRVAKRVIQTFLRQNFESMFANLPQSVAKLSFPNWR